MGTSAIRHLSEHTRSHARTLNPLARRHQRIAGSEFSPATAGRANTLQSKRTRSLGAYGGGGNRRSSGGTPRWYVEDQVSGAMHRPTSLPWIPARRVRRMPAVSRWAPSARPLSEIRITTTMCRPHRSRIIVPWRGSGRHSVVAQALRHD